MKKIAIVLCVVVSVIACKKQQADPALVYASFGDSISTEGVMTQEALLEKYKSLAEGDTVEVKFASVIKEVCQKKGCWMHVELNEAATAFIRFKDYGFFMPLNAAGSEVIVNGKAFVSVVSVADLKHYAKDAGKSQAEIDAITSPEITYSFTADGVLIKE